MAVLVQQTGNHPVAFVARQVEAVHTFRGQGHVGTAGVPQLFTEVAGIHALDLLVDMRTSPLHALCIFGVVRHGIDEVLDLAAFHQFAVVVVELEAVFGRTQCKLAGTDNLVADLDAVGQLFVLGRGGLVVGYLGRRVDRPVDVQLGQQCQGHVLAGLSVVVAGRGFGQLVVHFQQFLLDPFGDFGTWVAVEHVQAVFLLVAGIGDGSISEVLHDEEGIEATHGAGGAFVLFGIVGIDDFVGQYVGAAQYAHPVHCSVFRSGSMVGGVCIGITIHPVTAVGQRGVFVARKGHGFHVAAAQGVAELEENIGHIGRNGFRCIDKTGILGLHVNVQVRAAGQGQCQKTS